MKGIAMRNRHAAGRRRTAAFSGLLTLALALGATGSAFCQDADEEDVPLDTKLFRKFMHELGFRRDGNGVDYRERAPLVVPPSRDLPPPQNEGPSAQNPAWPKDPDAARRRNAAAAAEKAKLRSSNDMIEESRPLRPDELDKGRGSTTTQTGRTQMPRTTEETARPLSPTELGQNKNLLEGLFSSIGPQKAESAPFTGEPPRTTMTAPPPGYQTPSPNYPYGIEPTQAPAKPQALEQRLEPAR
jgi:hypothetical protein